MAGLYIDTSALGRVLLQEPDMGAIRTALDAYADWYSSELLAVELRRLATRASRRQEAEDLLGEITLIPLSRARLNRASYVEPQEVRTLDAIHLITAVELRGEGLVEAVLTYDTQLQTGCLHHGLTVETPPTRL